MGPARREQRLRRAQVGVHAEVEVGLAFGADRGGEVEDQVRPGECARVAGEQAGQVTADAVHPSVGREVAGDRCPVDEPQPRQRARRVAGHAERARRQQLPRQPGAEKTGTAGHHHVHHDASLRYWRA